MDIAPEGVVYVWKTMRCLDFVPPGEIDMKNVQNSAKYDRRRQGLICMEYCDGGSLNNWILKNKISDAILKDIISQVLGTIASIRKKYPHFNHNDLHMDNIFVSSQRGFLIGDFGWSRRAAMGTNPAVNTANGTSTASFWGVGPKTDPRYDIHYFLNELRDWLRSHDFAKYPRTMTFLDKAVPVGYRGSSDLHVGNFRLKYGDPCPGLPTLSSLLKDPYLSGAPVSSPNLQAAKARLRKVGSPAAKKLEPIVLRPKRRVTSPMLRAAMARLKKRNAAPSTNEALLSLSAANFLKLSPKTQARVKALRAAKKNAKGKGKATRATNARATNATKRTETRLENLRPKKNIQIPKEVLKSKKFEDLINKIWRNQGAVTNSYYNARNKARNTAMKQIINRLAAGKTAFSPSPPKAPSPKKTPSPPKAPSPKKTPSPPKAPSPKKTPSPPKAPNFRRSPNSGRVKIQAPKSGRWVYADGPTISVSNLKNIAGRHGISVTGLRSKADIVRKIFGI
jgi:serine/threonine protein kinase